MLKTLKTRENKTPVSQIFPIRKVGVFSERTIRYFVAKLRGASRIFSYFFPNGGGGGSDPIPFFIKIEFTLVNVQTCDKTHDT